MLDTVKRQILDGLRSFSKYEESPINKTLLMALHWASRIIAILVCIYLSTLGHSPLPISFLLPIGICASWSSWEIRNRKSVYPIMKSLVGLSLLISLIIFLYLLKRSSSDSLNLRHLIHLFINVQLILLLGIITLQEVILSLSFSISLLLLPICFPANPIHCLIIIFIIWFGSSIMYDKFLKPGKRWGSSN